VQEQEAYLAQLERENSVPAGKELVRPEAGFVLKVKKVENGEKVSIESSIEFSLVIVLLTKFFYLGVSKYCKKH
jgi:hypothetical protein